MNYACRPETDDVPDDDESVDGAGVRGGKAHTLKPQAPTLAKNNQFEKFTFNEKMNNVNRILSSGLTSNRKKENRNATTDIHKHRCNFHQNKYERRRG